MSSPSHPRTLLKSLPMTTKNDHSPLLTWRLSTLRPPRFSLISKRKPAREGRLLILSLECACLGKSAPHSFALSKRTRNNQNFTYMENFQLLICLSEDILVLFSNDDNYMRNLDDVWEAIQKQDPDHFRDVQLRILISHLAAIHTAFLNTFGGHSVHEVDAAISAAWQYAEEHMSPQYRQGL